MIIGGGGRGGSGGIMIIGGGGGGGKGGGAGAEPQQLGVHAGAQAGAHVAPHGLASRFSTFL